MTTVIVAVKPALVADQKRVIVQRVAKVSQTGKSLMMELMRTVIQARLMERITRKKQRIHRR